jgi:hypothetical protein
MDLREVFAANLRRLRHEGGQGIVEIVKGFAS